MPKLSSLRKEVYDPKAFILHAALLDQGFPHCPRFPTAASRRSLARVSVPVWPYTLSGRLLIDALVGRYPANKLISRGPLLERPKAFISRTYEREIVCGISPSFLGLFPTQGQVIHVLLTRLPLYSPLVTRPKPGLSRLSRSTCMC